LTIAQHASMASQVTYPHLPRKESYVYGYVAHASMLRCLYCVAMRC
jgi:hypothetical protein